MPAFSTRPLYAALLGASVFLLGACDSGGPEVSPGPTLASITVNLGAVQSFGDCDSDTNPGDFQFQVSFVDEGNNLLDRADLPNGTAYGTYDADTFIFLSDRDRRTLGTSLTGQRPRQEGSGFALTFAGMEWDSGTARDGTFDDINATASYGYRDGAFQGVVGAKSITLRGKCNVVLDYTITVQ